MIWNVEHEKHLTTLRGSQNQDTYEVPKLRNFGRNLITLHKEGIDFWQLVNPVIKFEVKKRCKLARMYFLEDSEHLMMVCDDKYFYLVEVDTFRIIREFAMPQGGYMYNLLPNGDVLVAVKNLFYNSETARIKKSRIPKTYRNLESVQEIESRHFSSDEDKPGHPIQKDLRKAFRNNVFGEVVQRKLSRTDSQRRSRSRTSFERNVHHYHTESEIMELATENMDTRGSEGRSARQPANTPERGYALQIKMDEDIRVQQVQKDIYRYSVMRLVSEEFREREAKGAVQTLEQFREIEYEGLFTIFQSDSEIVKIDSVVQKSKKSANTVYTLLSNPVIALPSNRNDKSQVKKNTVVLGLKNKEIFRIQYTTNRLGAPMANTVLIEKIFKKLHTFYVTDVNLMYSQVSNPEKAKDTSNVDNSSEKQYRVPEQRFWINSLKHFEAHEVTLASVLSKNNVNKNFFLNIMAQFGDESYSEIQLKFDNLASANLKDSFRIGLMNRPKPKRRQPKYFFFMQSSLLVATLCYNLSSKTLSILNSYKREDKNFAQVHFSRKRRLFFIANRNSVVIRDETLQKFVYSVKTQKEVDTIVLLDEQNILLVYDSRFYYELDLEELQFRRVIHNKISGVGGFVYKMDFTLLKPLVSWTAVFHGVQQPLLHALTASETLSLRQFPYQSLLSSFNPTNYRDHLRNFSEYYFNVIGACKDKDLFFGAMNPLLIAIYHNDSDLLEELLKTYTYPSYISNYISPIEFAFALNHRTNITVLCNNLIRNPGHAHMSRADFRILLQADIFSCHRLIATIPTRPKVDILPKLLYVENSVETRFENYITSLLIQLKNEEAIVDEEDQEDDDDEAERPLTRTNTFSDSHDASSFRQARRLEMLQRKEREIERSTAKFVEMHKHATHFKSEITVSTLPFRYDFRMGSEDSILFLTQYSSSNCEEFVFSDFGEVVNYKWPQVKLPHYIMFTVYLLFVVSFNISCIFLREDPVSRWLSVVLVIVHIIYELIQIIVYSSFKPRIYFTDIYNAFDWIIYINTLIYQLHVFKMANEDFVKIFNLVLLILVYYRGLSYMRIFDKLTTLIGILNIIFVRLLIFFFILLYLYLCCTFLMFRIITEDHLLAMGGVYFRIILGSIEGDAFDDRFGVIPMVIGSMIVTIFLINVLIAYLSNLFSRLEEQQKFQDMQERADLILEVEIVIRFFRYFLTGHVSVRKEYQYAFYKRMLCDAGTRRKIEFSDKKKNRILRDILSSEKYLYIIKRVEHTDSSNFENVYQRVKALEKSILALNVDVAGKFRATNTQIEKVLQIVKSNSNSQERTIDELREILAKKAQADSDHSEVVKEKLDAQDDAVKKVDDRLVALKDQVKRVLTGLTDLKSRPQNQS